MPVLTQPEPEAPFVKHETMPKLQPQNKNASQEILKILQNTSTPKNVVNSIQKNISENLNTNMQQRLSQNASNIIQQNKPSVPIQRTTESRSVTSDIRQCTVQNTSNTINPNGIQQQTYQPSNTYNGNTQINPMYVQTSNVTSQYQYNHQQHQQQNYTIVNASTYESATSNTTYPSQNGAYSYTNTQQYVNNDGNGNQQNGYRQPTYNYTLNNQVPNPINTQNYVQYPAGGTQQEYDANVGWNNKYYNVNRCQTLYNNMDRFYPMTSKPIVLDNTDMLCKDTSACSSTISVNVQKRVKTLDEFNDFEVSYNSGNADFQLADNRTDGYDCRRPEENTNVNFNWNDGLNVEQNNVSCGNDNLVLQENEFSCQNNSSDVSESKDDICRIDSIDSKEINDGGCSTHSLAVDDIKMEEENSLDNKTESTGSLNQNIEELSMKNDATSCSSAAKVESLTVTDTHKHIKKRKNSTPSKLNRTLVDSTTSQIQAIKNFLLASREDQKKIYGMLQRSTSNLNHKTLDDMRWCFMNLLKDNVYSEKRKRKNLSSDYSESSSEGECDCSIDESSRSNDSSMKSSNQEPEDCDEEKAVIRNEEEPIDESSCNDDVAMKNLRIDDFSDEGSTSNDGEKSEDDTSCSQDSIEDSSMQDNEDSVNSKAHLKRRKYKKKKPLTRRYNYKMTLKRQPTPLKSYVPVVDVMSYLEESVRQSLFHRWQDYTNNQEKLAAATSDPDSQETKRNDAEDNDIVQVCISFY